MDIAKHKQLSQNNGPGVTQLKISNTQMENTCHEESINYHVIAYIVYIQYENTEVRSPNQCQDLPQSLTTYSMLHST
jgi:hypothetical protein